MSTISLCMIVKNEEEVLARYLDCVRQLVDEIIICDTGSNDHTKEIAQQYTDRVFDFKWVDDFAAARNFSFSKATMDYILWLDADDVIEPADQQAFALFKKILAPPVDIVMMPYHVAFDDQDNPTMTYERERLLRREKGYRWESPIHEAITPTGNIIHCPIAICHRKIGPGDPDRNLRIFESMIAGGRRLDPRQHFYYARELMYHARYDDAIRELTAYLDGGDGWVENNITACEDLSRCYLAQGKREQARLSLCRSFCYDAPRAEICCALGASYLSDGDINTAIYWYDAARRRDKSSCGGFCSPDCHDFIPLLQLCVCYDRLGDHKAAEKCHRAAKKLKPDDQAVRYNDKYFRSLRDKQRASAD